MMASRLELRSWRVTLHASATDENAVSIALKSLSKHRVASFLKDISEGLASFDWRTSAMPDLSEDQRREKLVF
jgi:hypothetical protein